MESDQLEKDYESEHAAPGPAAPVPSPTTDACARLGRLDHHGIMITDWGVTVARYEYSAMRTPGLRDSDRLGLGYEPRAFW